MSVTKRISQKFPFMVYECLVRISQFVLCIYCILTVLFLLIPFLGFQKFVVVSGSMLPAIPVGSCILVKETEEVGIEPGEIITFYINNKKTAATHRVIENNQEARYFITKGDANDAADTAPIDYEDCIGTVCLILPVLGFLLVFLNSVYGKATAITILLVCFGLQSLNS